MEVDSALLHGQASPFLECEWAYQKLDMVIRELANLLLNAHGPWWQESSPANMLDFVIGEVQHLSNFPVVSERQ